jgi:hypothetical protein
MRYQKDESFMKRPANSARESNFNENRGVAAKISEILQSYQLSPSINMFSTFVILALVSTVSAFAPMGAIARSVRKSNNHKTIAR